MSELTHLRDGVVVSCGIEWYPQEINGTLVNHDEFSIALNRYFNYEKLLKKGAKLGTKLDEWKHLVSTFWPEPVFIHSRFTDMIFDALINYAHCSFIGMTTAGKTSCVALWCLLHFEWHRDEYGASFFSVNEVKLRETAFKELSRYSEHAACPIFGKRDITNLAILSSAGADSIGIRCRPLKIDSDPIAEITSMAGIHGNKTHDIILEEANACRESIFAAALNIQAGTSNSKIICNANPVELGDSPLSRFHMPIGGYESFDIMEPNCQAFGCRYCSRWETLSGVAIRFDGRDSPGIENPTKYHFNLRQDTIDQYEKTKHISPMVRDYYNIIMGWPRTVVSDTQTPLLSDFDEPKVRAAMPPGQIIGDIYGIDVAFHGDDPIVFAHLRMIELPDGFKHLHVVSINAIRKDQKNEIDHYKKCAEAISSYIKGASPKASHKNIGIDVTNGGYLFPEAISHAMGINSLPYGVSWSMWSDEKVSYLALNAPSSRQICYDRPTEIYTLMRDFVRAGMLTFNPGAGLEIFMSQAKKRYYIPDGKNGKLLIESKREYRRREGGSTDYLDAVCIACVVARDNFKIFPQTNPGKEISPRKSFVDKMAEMLKSKKVVARKIL